MNLFFYSFILLVLNYQFGLLDYKEWGDESETIVVCKMIGAGYKLYSQIYEPHGPLIYLPGLFLEKLGNFGIVAYRVLIFVFQSISLVCLYFSPLLANIRKPIKQIYLFIASSLLIIYYPKFFSHTYVYQNMAGLIILIVLAQYTLPAIFAKQFTNSIRIALCNVLIASLPFLGIAYIPATLFLFLCSVRKEYLLNSALWFLFGISINIVFIFSIGSLVGFYVYHFYFNTEIVPLFHSRMFYPTGVLSYLLNIFKGLTTNFSAFITLGLIAMLAFNIFSKEKFFAWRALLNWRLMLVILTMLSLLLRGSDFHGLPYYYAVLTFLLIFLYFHKVNICRIYLIAAPLAVLIFLKLLLLWPHDYEKIKSNIIPKTTEFSTLVDKVTNKEDRIIAYSWQPYEYIASRRFPASGALTYFPWQVKYTMSPIMGINVDGCIEIQHYKPKVMLVDKLNVYGVHAWSTYGQCIDDIISHDYIQIKNRPYYLRRDIAKQNTALLSTFP